MITIRKMRPGEEMALWSLFYQTVRTVNIQDYTPEQVAIWAPDNCNEIAWKNRMQHIYPYVAVRKNAIVGYADVQTNGYIDHFFVDAKTQGKGVGKALMNVLFREGGNMSVARFYSNVSITAKPFFQRMGFQVVKVQQVEKAGAVFTNYIMEKRVEAQSAYTQVT
ncbi:GNAT family N-acetyltransferase [Enterovibrio calviensis]|uniref:GNAT family N-acetyltransferase n=1 Tax=Enterovibrio calviensis TaxID=91359 RepID=UPI0004840964|nr:GNAT family N-acetyltransferase [Enterovibrio calviensis]